MTTMATTSELAGLIQGSTAGIAISLLDLHDPSLQFANGPWIDPISRKPCVVGIATMPVPAMPPTTIVVDLRQSDALAIFITALEGAGIVVCHDLARVIAALHDIGSRLRNVAWFDTRLAERALHLNAGDDDVTERHGLTSCLAAHRLTSFSFAWSPDLGDDHVLESLTSATTDTLPASAIQQAAALADATAALAAAQQQAIPPALWQHLRRVEMPAALEHALCTVTGVRLDTARCQRLRTAVPAMITTISARLAEAGLSDPGSQSALQRWLRQLGILDAFPHHGGHYHISDDALKELQHKHPPLRWLRQLRKIEDLAYKPWLAGMMTSGDGRVHPEHLPFQAPTSRSSTRRPELTSLPRQLRPLVAPAAGNGIVELDYKGMEILVAAIRFNDQKLLDAYASGDVISFLAREIFPRELRELSLVEIAEHHDELRSQAKTIAYGVLYGRKAHSLARSLGVSEMGAQRLIDRLLAFCPAVAAGMKKLVNAARRTGRIPIAFGLARYLTAEERSQPWMVGTRAKNTPIQGTAAVIFRYAMVLVARAIATLGGRIILPVHDAFVLEGPLPQLAVIITVAKQAMIDAFRLVSPTATPFVEVDDANPACWCKKGKADSFERYVEDPTMD